MINSSMLSFLTAVWITCLVTAFAAKGSRSYCLPIIVESNIYELKADDKEMKYKIYQNGYKMSKLALRIE